jgi:hypothetical protein
MKTALMGLVGFLMLGSGIARAQEGAAMTYSASGQLATAPQAVAPTVPGPVEVPPAPPAQPPPPPIEATQQQAPQVAVAAPVPQSQGQVAAGQWVYTTQYGWLWMPYGTQYTYEGTGSYDAQPYSYVYYPTLGWSWLVAPWVWGWGGYPYFGVVGAWHFPWYRGLYQAGYGWGGYRGGYARAYANGYRGMSYAAGSYRGRPAFGGGYGGGSHVGGYAGTYRGAPAVNTNGYSRGNH